MNACEVTTNDPECALNGKYRHQSFRGDEAFCQMVSFFCGHEPVCRKFNNKTALQKALHNLEKKYAVVGVLESFERSLQVLESYVPMYFRGAVTFFKNKPLEKNKNEHSPETPPVVQQVLAARLWADIELYQFVQQRLYLQYHRMGGRTGSATTR